MLLQPFFTPPHNASATLTPDNQHYSKNIIIPLYADKIPAMDFIARIVLKYKWLILKICKFC